MDNSNVVPIQRRISKVLYCVQILHQNGCIDVNQKNKIVSLLQKSRKSKDMTEIHDYCKTLLFGATLPEVVEDILRITSNEIVSP